MTGGGSGDEDTRVDTPAARAPTPAEKADAEATVRQGRGSRNPLPPSTESSPTLRDADPERDAPPSSRRDPDEPSGSMSQPQHSRTSLGESHASSSITSLGDAMDLQDVERTRGFLQIAWPVCLAVAAPLPWLGGDPLASKLFGAGMLVAASVSLWFERSLRDPSNYTVRRQLVVAATLVACIFPGILFCGVFSPAPAVIPLGLYFFGLARSSRGTFAIYVACNLAYLALALPFSLDWLPDPGLVTAAGLPRINRIAIVGLTLAIFMATFVASRRSRRATVRALTLHEEAVRDLAAREALLHEARLDLEGVLQARGLGRFTDETVGVYRLGALIGRGGMGEVYDGVHVDSEERAAVKLLHPQVLGEPGNLERFLREARAAARLDSPHVVRVLATSEPEAPIPFIAMERLHGEDLADHLRARGRMPLAEVVRLVREVGAAIDVAREAGIVHRDIKPRNVFLAEVEAGQTRWKILDFGISKLAGEATMTHHQMVGTPSYMAPEQASGGRVTHQSDVFSLAVIAYRAITGRPPFSGEAMAQILYQVVHSMPPRPSALVDVPREVDAVLALGLAKKAKERLDSGGELADALERAARGKLSSKLGQRAGALLRANPWSG